MMGMIHNGESLGKTPVMTLVTNDLRMYTKKAFSLNTIKSLEEKPRMSELSAFSLNPPSGRKQLEGEGGAPLAQGEHGYNQSCNFFFSFLLA